MAQGVFEFTFFLFLLCMGVLCLFLVLGTLTHFFDSWKQRNRHVEELHKLTMAMQRDAKTVQDRLMREAEDALKEPTLPGIEHRLEGGVERRRK